MAAALAASLSSSPKELGTRPHYSWTPYTESQEQPDIRLCIA